MGLQRITILGSTGSIGVSTLDVVRRYPDRYEVFALSANTNVERLFDQICAARPRYAVLRDEASAEVLHRRLRDHGVDTTVLAGEQALCRIASDAEVDAVMAAIVGGAGLMPTLAAARAGKKVLLANKESLVMSGALFMQAVHDSGALLLPIDSEHNAIFQCLPANYRDGLDRVGVRRILLTGSGGPFRTTDLALLADVTPDQACAHPNWAMGRKISVDSATMMNKGLELIEACWLFDTTPAAIDIVIHPQSVIHSMVEYVDGSVLAQLGNPDMRTPIAHALAWPQRMDSGVSSLDIIGKARLDFSAPDYSRFPCLALAIEAAQRGGNAMIALNAANEVAVQAFLDRKLRFTEISSTIAPILARVDDGEPDSLEAVKALDIEIRARTHSLLNL
jgi:1-deoxy-D-xylulose-5-phosphate reductoisomerase